MVSLDCCAVEVMDSSMAVADGAGRGAEATSERTHGRLDSGCITDEDVPEGRASFLAEVAILDKCVHDSPEDGAALADQRWTGADGRDVRDASVDCHASESDEDGCGEAACLQACMTPSGQDYYLRRGGTPRRRSALRLSRIIARQQLLRRLSQGRNRASSEIFVEIVSFEDLFIHYQL